MYIYLIAIRINVLEVGDYSNFKQKKLMLRLMLHAKTATDLHDKLDKLIIQYSTSFNLHRC